MVLVMFSWYYIFAMQKAFYFLRFEDKTNPHVTMATEFVGLCWTLCGLENKHIFVIFAALINAKV